MRKWFNLLSVFICVFAFALPSQAVSRKKKKIATEVKKDSIKSKKTKYQKLFDHPSHVESRGDFLTIHKVKGKIYFEMPLKTFGRDMLLSSTIKETSDSDIGFLGSRRWEPQHLKFVLKDSLVMTIRPRAVPVEGDPDMQDLMKMSYREAYSKKYKVEAYSPDSTAVVFDMTNAIVPGPYPLIVRWGMYQISGKFKVI